MSYNRYIPVYTSDGETSPCAPDCKERSATCHGTCEKYLRYQRALHSEQLVRTKTMNAISDSYEGMRKNKTRRAKKHYGY